jgi:hypothetical protein
LADFGEMGVGIWLLGCHILNIFGKCYYKENYKSYQYHWIFYFYFYSFLLSVIFGSLISRIASQRKPKNATPEHIINIKNIVF